MISVWSASEAHALREAMRMSIDDFASHLGVSRRGVAAWSGRGGSRLRWDVQRKLDDALAAAPAAVRQRLAQALSAQRSPAAEPAAGQTPSPPAEASAAKQAALALLLDEPAEPSAPSRATNSLPLDQPAEPSAPSRAASSLLLDQPAEPSAPSRATNSLPLDQPAEPSAPSRAASSLPLDQTAEASGEMRARSSLFGELAETGPGTQCPGSAGAAQLVAALGALLIPPPQARGVPPPALIRLELQVARVRMAYQEARYRAVVDGLPVLAQSLAEARADAQVRFPHRVRRLASAVHQTAAGLLLKLGELPLAMLAAERSASEAEASGDPLVIAASARCTAQALQRSGHHERALACARDAARELADATGLHGPRPLSAYGALLLGGAVAAAHAADRATAAELLVAAARAAKTLGVEGNFGWTAFGPSNVSLHRLDVLLCLAEPAAALQVSAAIDPTAILQPERLATYHVDSARAFQAIAQPAAAVSALRKAYAVAPDEVRMRPDTRLLASELAQAVHGPARARAARFAELVLTP